MHIKFLSATGLCLFFSAAFFAPTAALAEPPQPPASAAPAEDGTWRMPAKNYASTRFSGLDEINASNVGKMQVAFTFSMGVNHGQESAPLVFDNTLYVVGPYPNNLYALDLTQAGAPLKWQYQPNPDAASQGEACCDTVNRGPTSDAGKIFYNTLDDHTVAVDAKTGKEVWKVKVGDYTHGETMTMAPLIVKGKVLVGNSGGEFGIRGWLKALDEDTGKVLWTAYTAGPDGDVLIGPDFKPFYDQDKGKDLGVTTWPADAWRNGGGGMWGWISYDPDLNEIFYGTANPGPWNSDIRPGANKFAAGIFARDPDTGAAKWYYQTSPHDIYDHDSVNENILLDGVFNGQQRKVMVRPDRNALIYVIDRTTGEVLSADKYVPDNTNDGVDLKTGLLKYNPDKKTETGKTIRDICPSAPGSKDWNPSAYSIKTGLLYVPHNMMCMDWESTAVNYIAGTPYVGANVQYYPADGYNGNEGEFMAWDPVQRKKIWTIPNRFPLWSGAAVTAGNVVFYGDLEGWFYAVDATSGKELWKFKTGSGIIGQPTVYKGPDGHEYIAILSGIGGWAGAIVAGDRDPRDSTTAVGWGTATGPLKQLTNPGGMLYVFSLPPA